MGWRRPSARTTQTPTSAISPIADTDAELADAVTVEHFYAYLPSHQYIFVPSRELWPAVSVNARLGFVRDADGAQMRASDYLDRERAVEQMVWTPANDVIVENRFIDNGGWVDHHGARCFNQYRPPSLSEGDAALAAPWVTHVERVYGDDSRHVIHWLAQRVQQPAIKINHALVLGGNQGVGKDTILEPVKHAIGPWNFHEVSPQNLLGRFNSFVKSVILRVSEARDLGDVDRYGFYEHMKTYTATPPDVLRCDEKNVREYSVLNCCGVIITSNHKADGIYLPADDRRHYVAWSDLERSAFDDGYWRELYGWYGAGGVGHVAAYLQTLDLSVFDPKAPPPKTPAFWEIVDAGRAPESAELADVLESLNSPDALTLEDLMNHARYGQQELADWLGDRKSRRIIPHRLESAGYVPVRNDAANDGMWRVAGRRQAVYAKRSLNLRDRIQAASARAGQLRN